MMPPGLQEFWRVTSLIGVMLTLGFIFDHPLFFLVVACLLYLNWHLYNLFRLMHWFREKRKTPLPDAFGLWGETFYQFYRLQQRNRKRKRKLTTMLKRIRRSIAAMPDAAVILNGNNFEIEWFNKMGQVLLGLQAPQDRQQPITNLIRYPNFMQFLKEGDKEDSIVITAPNDPTLILRVNVVPYAGNRHLLIARDITRIQRLEQMRRDFIANVSHELRTPLTVIAGFLETINDPDDPCAQQWQRPLLLMTQQTARMRNIVDDLLLLSRLESEVHLSSVERIDIIEMLQDICEEAQILSGEQNHHITLETDEDAILYGHAEEIRSAFSNLIFNAIRYTPAEGDINVRWYSDTNGLHLEVHDTGEGIPPEHIPRLTERFYRVDIARSRNRGGTGLGLAIVKHVLNRHKGHLRIASTVGEGSTFWCEFPHDANKAQYERMHEML
ncbi:phosphate regulon sensor histidine kinase PhoR [Beggiatoa leptomitoformis]|uniref:Phosphate regulon sensor protein PhoR n=1 Tax=Beggiatoa leptomitoformis TaxID=288004 RepID=A0A2N9YB32_9GAMM|nr:phosphate regulon sensor histidine kinase PhoR [Beggiatoa leptomitoformis]ALG66948.2 phosphate regulon sensor histidine kinase PhoR [Beggiatoa leptomitoformis]AUI67683.2 phosphate regulon sensor histidine kinase PhoR [Beggiatoa leptomitoformis]